MKPTQRLFTEISRRTFLQRSAGTLAASAGFAEVANARDDKSKSDIPSGDTGVPHDLRCEFLVNPIGVTIDKPALSWQIKDSRRGASQTAYRIQVASSPELLEKNEPDLRDSEKTKSGQSHLVQYGGKKLSSCQRVWWRVTYWDQDGVESRSEPTWWEMGILQADEFKGEWISAIDQPLPEGEVEQQWVKDATLPEAGQWLSEEFRERVNKAARELGAEALKKAIPAYQLRREFDLTEPVRIARLYICTLGYHEITLNGEKIDDHRLDPGFSHYSVRADYVVKDITAKLKKGTNCLGLLLGSGRYHEQPGYNNKPEYYGKKPVVKAMLVIETQSGKKIEITTDKLWKSDISFITRDCFWVGEVQDARRIQSGWDEAGFDDETWKGVEVVSEGLPKTVDAQIYPPEKEMERVKPVALTNPAPGVWVFDMGRCLVGNAEVKINAPRGTAVSVRYAHLLWGEYPDWYRDYAALYCPSYDDMSVARQAEMIVAKRRGDTTNFSPANLLKDYSSPELKGGSSFLMNADLFVTRGQGAEVFQRRFGYRPFRYIEVRGFPGKPSLDAVTGVVLHTYLDSENRSFATSNDLLNQIELAGERSVLYNLHSHSQDNSGAEKGFFPHMNIWNFPQYALGGEFASVAIKELREVRAFTKDLGLGSVFTSHRRSPGPDEKLPPWSSISEMQHYVELPWVYYRYYGDRRELELHYESMKRYIDYVYRNVESKGFLLADQYGDVWDAGANRGIINCFKFVEDKGYVAIGKFGTSKDFYATAIGYKMVKKAAEIATLLGHADDAAKFAKLRDGAREFIQSKFFEPDGPSYCSKYSNTIQGSHALAIDWGVSEKQDDPALVSQIKEDLKKNGHLTTGSRLSFPLLSVLSKHGAIDSAYEIMARTEYPSLGHLISFYGTIPEGWGLPGLPDRGSPVQTELSGMTAWFYEDLCGLQPDSDNPGFKHFFVEPKIPSKLDSAQMETESPYGRIKTSWQKSKKSFLLNVTVPPNTTATVAIPVIDNVATPVIREGRDALSKAQGVRVIKTSKTEVTCEVQSGSYSFSYDVELAE